MVGASRELLWVLDYDRAVAQFVLRLKGREILRHEISQMTTRIGRDPTNELVIDNPGVSRIHAAVVFEDPDFVLMDQGSANGVHVNGERIQMRRLREGDRVEIGKFELLFNLDETEMAKTLLGGLVIEEPSRPHPVRTVRVKSITAEDLEAHED